MPHTGCSEFFEISSPYERCVVRTALSLFIVAGLAVSLTACSTTGTPEAEETTAACTPTASGAVSDAITVTGDFGTKPTVEVSSPVSAEETQRTVAIEGDGDQAVEGDIVNVEFSLYSAETGAELSATEYADAPTQFEIDETKFLAGIAKTLDCSTVGSRLVGVIPPADSWGETGSTELGVAATDSIVFVADVISVEPPIADKAWGEDQEPVEGFPVVELAEDGTPTLTIPKTDPPTELGIEVLKKGDGEVVADGATVTVHYIGVNWTSGETFDSSWARGEPAAFATTGVIEGFGTGLVGQTVGSQVVIVIPPDLGYGPSGGSPDAGIAEDDTIVFVVDILATS